MSGHVKATPVSKWDTSIVAVQGKSMVALFLNGQPFALSHEQAQQIGQALLGSGAIASLSAEQLDELRKQISPVILSTRPPLALG